MLIEVVCGIVFGFWVLLLNWESGLVVGLGLLGWVIDGNGQLFDGLGLVESMIRVLIVKLLINFFICRLIDLFMDVGVRVINVLNIVGIGQCMGLFVGSGVGKSVLLGMMICGVKVDVVVVGFVGEWG